MKGSRNKFIAFGIILLMLVSIIQLPIMANTDDESIILKKSEKEFLLYYKEICNREFEFAFSSNQNENEENLNFTKSAVDQMTQNALNVAYIDEESYDAFFSTNKSAYIWIRDVEEKMLVESKKVNLEQALDDEMIQLVDTTTKRILVDTTKTNTINQIINGVDTTVTTGKVVIRGKENANYAYKIVKVSDQNIEAKELFTLAEQIDNGTNKTYESLSLTKSFYNLYKNLVPTDSEWLEVENKEILQPENTANGDKYIVWIKEETEKDTTIDAKFLMCIYEYEEGKEEKEETIIEIVKLPVTFDSGTILFIILGLIAVALIVVIVIKTKSNKKEEKK